ncbi:MAG: methyltransferase domain-containing protein [Chloroflexi bacterium]|nr:methyltransferase domain-containing protein [Chloroflexota bacterium]
MSHNDTVQREFTKQAAAFSSLPSISNTDNMQWMLDHLVLNPNDKVLDVAAGTGHLSRAIAPYVREVIALDLTRAMIEQGKRETSQADITNIRFEEGIAENLPYADASFDLTVTRFSLHHFENPLTALREMWRILKRRGRIAVIDLISPDDSELAATYNHLERLRDPSHAIALSSNELLKSIAEVGFDSVRGTMRDVEVNLPNWLNLTQTPAEARRMIQKSIDVELTGGKRTGMHPFRRDEDYMFLHRWMVVTGIKKS